MKTKKMRMRNNKTKGTAENKKFQNICKIITKTLKRNKGMMMQLKKKMSMLSQAVPIWKKKIQMRKSMLMAGQLRGNQTKEVENQKKMRVKVHIKGRKCIVRAGGTMSSKMSMKIKIIIGNKFKI